MYVNLLRGIEDAARAAGYTAIVAESRNDPDIEALHLQALLDRRVDGLLCAPVQSVTTVARAAESAGVPVVMVAQRVPHASSTTAFVDELDGIHAAMEQLVALGHRRFAVVHGATSARMGVGRARGEVVRKYLETHGLADAPAAHTVRTFAKGSECESLVAKLMRSRTPPTALLVGSHQFLPEVLLGIRAAGMAVPDDVSLVAFGDSRWAEAMRPAVSVITSDQRQHARDAVELLLRMIEGDESAPRSVRREAVFVPRASCAPVCGTTASGNES